MIQEDYVSFKTAKLLKEKGFEPPHDYRKCIPIMYTDNGEIKWGVWSDDWYPRITLQMATKWLREKHEIFIQPNIVFCYPIQYFATIFCYGDNLKTQQDVTTENFESPEEACEAAIKYCLENLI